MELECDYCGKKINIFPYELKKIKNHFCSQPCHYKFKSANKTFLIDTVCDYCKKIIKNRPRYEIKKNAHNFCNRKCNFNWRKGKDIGKSTIEVDMTRNATLAYVIAVVCGDGYVYIGKNRYFVELAVKDKEFAESFLLSLKKMGMHPYLYQTKKDIWVVVGNSKVFSFWYKLNGAIPNWIIKKREYRIAWLKGFYEAEGGTHYRKPDKNSSREYLFIHFTNLNITYLKFVQHLLILEGYHPTEISCNRDVFLCRQKEIFDFHSVVKPVIKKVEDDNYTKKSI